MRRLMIALTLVLLLAVSIGVGVTVARWPLLWRGRPYAPPAV
jgi:hypothetical protein